MSAKVKQICLITFVFNSIDMKTITVNVFRDETGYHENGIQRAIPADVRIIGYETLQESDFDQVSQYSNRLLKVFHVATAHLWIDDTIDTLQAKINAASSSGGTLPPIQFKIGDGGALTPLAGTTSYANPVMAGATSQTYLVHVNGRGYLIEGEDFDFKVGGGFDLLGGNQFDDQTFWTIEKI